MSALVGSDLRVHTLLMPEASLSSPQHLEVDPTEADLLKLPLNVPPQEIVTRQVRAAFRRKHQRTRSRIRRDFTPGTDILCKIGGQSSLPSPPLGLRVVGKPSIDALSDLDHLLVNFPPSQ